jgi:REP element-mobilizing transposase RayT
MNKTIYPACFFTATILNWQPLLKPDKHKDIILKSLYFLKNDCRIFLYAFVIMPNHIHLIWQPCGEHLPKKIQHSFLKFTAQQIKFEIINTNSELQEQYKVNATDREYQFWERNPLSIELYHQRILLQKLNYLHNNPVKAGFCKYPEEYKFSSALFYETDFDEWGILTHYLG